MVLVHELRHLTRLYGSIDADRHRGFSVHLAVVANNQPAAIGPLHDLRMVDFAHCITPARLIANSATQRLYPRPESPLQGWTEVQFVRDSLVNWGARLTSDVDRSGRFVRADDQGPNAVQPRDSRPMASTAGLRNAQGGPGDAREPLALSMVRRLEVGLISGHSQFWTREPVHSAGGSVWESS